MDVRAAVAFEAGKPLQIETVQLEGPKEGEVLVEIKATGICHTDKFTLSGEDPEGAFPVILGHEGAGVVVDVGPGVRSLKKGDHVIPLYTPECRECEYCLSRKTNLCVKIRATQGKGLMPDGTSRFSYKGKPILHYMGCSSFANYTVLPEIALAKVREDAPFDKICYIGCGVTTGVGAVIFTAKVQPGDNVVVFGLGGIGLNVVQGARIAGADMIVGVDLNPRREALARKFGMTHFVNPKEVEGDLVAYLVELTKGGADHSFECVGNVNLMRQALECAHRGWGKSTIIGVAGAGQEIRTRPFQLVTGRVWQGTAFGGARGRTDVPGIVDWYMEGKINIDDLITHTLPLERINEGFDLMARGESIRTVVVDQLDGPGDRSLPVPLVADIEEIDVRLKLLPLRFGVQPVILEPVLMPPIASVRMILHRTGDTAGRPVIEIEMEVICTPSPASPADPPPDRYRTRDKSARQSPAPGRPGSCVRSLPASAHSPVGRWQSGPRRARRGVAALPSVCRAKAAPSPGHDERRRFVHQERPRAGRAGRTGGRDISAPSGAARLPAEDAAGTAARTGNPLVSLRHPTSGGRTARGRCCRTDSCGTRGR